MDLEEAVEALSTSGLPPERLREGLEITKKLLTNIWTNPAEAKFRQVKKTNPAVQSRLLPQCMDILRAVGFKDDDELLVYRYDPGPLLTEAIAIVESLLMSLPGGSSTATSSSAVPSSAAGRGGAAPGSAAGSSASCGGGGGRRGGAVEAKKPTPQQMKHEKAREEAKRSQANAQEQLAALRQQRAGQYLEQQDLALAHHLSGRDADAPYDAIAALNASRGAVHSFVTCTRCGMSLRYNSATRAQAVLCPCGMLLQPVAMRGQAFAPSAPSDLPVEPGEPVDSENRPRGTRGPFITVRGADGQATQMPLHSVLQMVRQHEARQMAGAHDETIEALPTRTYEAGPAGGATKEESNCQICMEDFEEGDELRTLPCFHLFHAKCVDQWLKVNSVCPTCRHKVG